MREGYIDALENLARDIAPGHDAWIIGDEVFVGLEFKSAAEYAKPG